MNMINRLIPKEEGLSPDFRALPLIHGIVSWLLRLIGITPGGRHLGFLGLMLVLAVVSIPSISPKDAIIVFPGKPIAFKTNVRRIGAVLEQAGVRLEQGSLTSPPLWDTLGEDGVVRVEPAIPLHVRADGRASYAATRASTVTQALEEAGFQLAVGDEIIKDGHIVAPDASLSGWAESSGPLGVGTISAGATRSYEPSPHGVALEIRRAFPIYLHESGLIATSFTTADTVGEALFSAGVALSEEDRVLPAVETRASAGLHVFLRRAKEVQLAADGEVSELRTAAATVGELLYRQGVLVGTLDRVEPGLGEPITTGMLVKVTRLRQEVRDVTEVVPAPVQYQRAPDLELDTQMVVEPGNSGLLRRQVRIVYEDGQETQRIVESERLETEPKARVIAYGAKIVLRELSTAEGTVTYWRRFRAFVTSYDASQGGKPRGHPAYGITATGMQAGYGVVAVDPSVIPLYSRLYVPGYGTAVAGDTGGGVRGMMVDLGFPEGQDNAWTARWADVYLLTPVPPAETIRWVLPN